MSPAKHALIQALIQGALWGAVATVITMVVAWPALSVEGKMSPLAFTVLFANIAYWGGVIAGFGAVNAARKDAADGKIAEEEIDPTLVSPLRPVWLAPTILATVYVAVLVAVVGGIAHMVFTDGMPRWAVAVFAAIPIIVLASSLASSVSRKELRKYRANPEPRPRPLGTYFAIEYASGNFLANLLINGAFGYVLFLPMIAMEGGVPLMALIIDLVVMDTAIAILVPLGVWMQTSADARAKWIAVTSGGGVRGQVRRHAIYIVAAQAITVICIGGMLLLGLQNYGLWPAMLIKGGVSAVVAVAVAWLACRFEVNASVGPAPTPGKGNVT